MTKTIDATLGGLLVAVLLASAATPAAETGTPQSRPDTPGMIRVQYFSGQGEKFEVTAAASCRAVMEWLNKAQNGLVSEHAKEGACDRDAEIAIYNSPSDTKPKLTVELFTSCNHVSGHVVTADQFAQLHKMLASPSPQSASAPTSATASAPSSKPARTKASDKGWEVYVWQDGGMIRYSLLPGTNRLKTDGEVVKAGVNSLEAVERQLDELKEGQFVSIVGRRLDQPAPREQALALLRYLKKSGLKLAGQE